MSLGLRRMRGMRNELGVKRAGIFRHISRKIRRADAQRDVRAFFRYGRKTTLVASQLAHPMYRALMLAVPAAAGR
jgi:hypothetical protein